MSQKTRTTLLLVTLLAAISLTPGCATNPVSGDAEIVLMSEAKELRLGTRYDPEIRKQYGVYGDPKLRAYIDRIGQRLAAQSHRPGLRYHFTVLDSPEVNAFALPGGYVYITRGILAYINSEAELAAVLGHEIGHVTARHSVRQYTAATAANLGATIASLFVPELANAAGQQLLGSIGGALLSGYGREHELEADRLGAEYLARAGYDPEAVIGVIGLLKNQEEFEKKQAAEEGRKPRVYHGVFASHPSTDQRLREVVGEAQKFKAAGRTRTAREEYFKQINNMVFGDSTRLGVMHERRLINKDIGFTLTFPEDWKIHQSSHTVTAIWYDQEALLQLWIEDSTAGMEPKNFLYQKLNPKRIEREGSLDGTTLPNYTVVAYTNSPYGKRDTRISVVQFNNKALIFFGVTKNRNELKQYDRSFLDTARSLRPITAKEKKLADGPRIGIKKINSKVSFASIAKQSPLRHNPEAVLRLLNDKFPTGEPEPGELIKIVE